MSKLPPESPLSISYETSLEPSAQNSPLAPESNSLSREEAISIEMNSVYLSVFKSDVLLRTLGFWAEDGKGSRSLSFSLCLPNRDCRKTQDWVEDVRLLKCFIFAFQLNSPTAYFHKPTMKSAFFCEKRGVFLFWALGND